MLRQPRRIMFQLRQPGAGRLSLMMLAVTVLCSLLYGLVTGSFSMGGQLWAAPVKIVCGLLISGLICLPRLFIFPCLSGPPQPPAGVLRPGPGRLLAPAPLLRGFAPGGWLVSPSLACGCR